MAAREVTVRRATSADVPAIVELLRELGYEVLPESVVATLADEGSVVLVAEIGGTTAGVLNAHFRTQLHHGLVGRIDELVVGAEHRRERIGAALVAACVGAATTRGARLVEVTCRLSRADAHAFYEAAGFRRTSLRFELDVVRT